MILHGMGATSETGLVSIARAEARAAKERWNSASAHTPSQIGFPPNECADVLAMMGRLHVSIDSTVAETYTKVAH